MSNKASTEGLSPELLSADSGLRPRRGKLTLRMGLFIAAYIAIWHVVAILFRPLGFEHLIAVGLLPAVVTIVYLTPTILRGPRLPLLGLSLMTAVGTTIVAGVPGALATAKIAQTVEKWERVLD